MIKDGEIKYVFNNIRDITGLNKVQDSLRDKGELIQLQNKQLENMKIRLGLGTIIAKSKSFTEIVELAQRVASFDGASVLILGESGTGKELISVLIVDNSPRKNMPYVQVNCGANAIDLDVRIIAAANKNLEDMVRKGTSGRISITG